MGRYTENRNRVLKKKRKTEGKKIGVKSLAFLSIYLLLSSGKIQQKYGVNFQFIWFYQEGRLNSYFPLSRK